MQPRIEETNAHYVLIHMAGDYEKAVKQCREYCDMHGLCVTVTPTIYVYTGGHEDGVTVRLMNYARFPKEPVEIDTTAYELAWQLRHTLGQDSFTLETPKFSRWYSWRAEDRHRASDLKVTSG